MSLASRFYKASEIAAILQISRALAYQLIASGSLSAVRFGRTVRVRQEDFDRFLAAHAPPPDTADGAPVVPMLDSKQRSGGSNKSSAATP